MRGVRFVLLSSLLAVAACGGAEQFDEQTQQSVDVQPDGKGGSTLDAYLNPAKPTGSLVQAGIQFHGGGIMSGTKTVYYIWYGNWAGNTATTILPAFAQGVGGSGYFNINTTYTNSGGTAKVDNSVVYGGSTTVAYPYGTSLSDAKIQQVVTDAINSGALPKNTNGVYFVLTSQDVTASSGFCTQYCGWHTHGTIGGSDIKYSFVGNAARCPSSCAGQTAASPNGNIGADGMASIIAHELEEAATDPDLNAWYDSSGAENADKCAWTWGSTTTVGSYKYNQTFGGRNWLIQQNWVNSGAGFCAKSF